MNADTLMFSFLTQFYSKCIIILFKISFYQMQQMLISANKLCRKDIVTVAIADDLLTVDYWLIRKCTFIWVSSYHSVVVISCF